MSEFPWYAKEVVTLEHPYSKAVREAVMAAKEAVLAKARTMLVDSAWSPIPKDTGHLREETVINLTPSPTGVVLRLFWPVDYAKYLIEHAGEWQFAHAKDPMAVGDFPQPALEMVWYLFLNALLKELAVRGIEFGEGGEVTYHYPDVGRPPPFVEMMR